MPDLSFANLLVVCAIAVVAPLLLGFAPRVRVPSAVLEIVAGILVGPAVLGWVDVDVVLRVLSLIGLAFLLFLAGLEIDLGRLRGPLLRLALLGYVVTIALGLVAIAEHLGLENILGAFLAGAVVGLVDRDNRSHPQFRVKLEAVGYGFVIPVFFVTSGIGLDLQGLVDEPAALLRVPVFLVALLAVRGLPALLYLPSLGRQRTLAAALLQATSLPFIVTAATLGVAVGELTSVNAAALVCAGLLSVVVFPAVALSRLRAHVLDGPDEPVRSEAR